MEDGVPGVHMGDAAGHVAKVQRQEIGFVIIPHQRMEDCHVLSLL